MEENISPEGGKETASKSKNSISVPIVVVVALILLGAIFFFTRSQDESEVSSLPSESEAVSESSAETTPAQQPLRQNEESVKVFDVSGKPFEFSVKEIKVKKGDTVRINFTSTEGFHDWTVDEFDAGTNQLSAGQSDSVEFVADKAGTFEYYCSVANHRQLGMVGKLIVE